MGITYHTCKRAMYSKVKVHWNRMCGVHNIRNFFNAFVRQTAHAVSDRANKKLIATAIIAEFLLCKRLFCVLKQLLFYWIQIAATATTVAAAISQCSCEAYELIAAALAITICEWKIVLFLSQSIAFVWANASLNSMHALSAIRYHIIVVYGFLCWCRTLLVNSLPMCVCVCLGWFKHENN